MLHSRGFRALLRRVSASLGDDSVSPTPPRHPTPAAPGLPSIPKASAPLTILWIDEQLPDPGRDSGSLRMLNILRLLVAMGHRVDVLAMSRTKDPASTKRLLDAGIGQLAPRANERPETCFLHSGKRYDAVIISRYHLALPWLPLVRSVHPAALTVLDTVDMHHLREQGEAELRGNPWLRMAAGATRRLELGAVDAADAAWVVNESERRMLQDVLPGKPVHLVSNVHGLPTLSRNPGPGARLLFVGGAQHPPNADAARWLLEHIFPIVRSARPDCELHLVGRDLSACAQDLVPSPGIVFHGQVENLEPLLATSHIGLAPLRFGAGVKGKVNQYMAFGLPTVATSVAVEGMYVQNERDVLVAETSGDIAKAVLRLLDDPDLQRTLSAHGRENLKQHFSFEAAIPGIRATLGSHVRSSDGT